MKTKILMLGTKANGGMKTVVNAYLNSSIGKNITFISTHIESNKLVKATYFAISIIRIVPFLLSSDYKIVHMHTSIGASLKRKGILTKIAKLFKKKVILHTHGADFTPYYTSLNKIQKEKVNTILNNVDAFIVLSEKRKKEYSEILDESKIKVIPNFIPLPKSFKKKSNKAPLIITLGRLGERKGTPDLIKTLSLIKEPFVAELGGDGEIDITQKQIDKLNLKNKVKLLGWTTGKDKEDLLKSADIFVLPSYFEDMPMAILEAMSYGLPIISTNVAGIPEVVKHNKNGILIKPGDIQALTKALDELITNKPLRDKMGKESVKIIKTKFEQKLVEKKISELYESLVKN